VEINAYKILTRKLSFDFKVAPHKFVALKLTHA